jgi:alpha-D-ribose 1-methylphosphonate 5-triphosphate synthase subunit PhnH
MACGRRREIGTWLGFHTGAALAAEPAEASFALIDGCAAEPPLALFPQGEDRYPDRSATIIVECDSLVGGETVTLSGPGVDGICAVSPRGLRPGFWRECAHNHAQFPLGFDVLFVAGDTLMALPRSIAIAEEGSPCMSR